MKNALQYVRFIGAYCVFAGLGFSSSVVCFVLSFFLKGERVEISARKFISKLFRLFLAYCRRFGVIEVDARELASLSGCRGVIFVANHPSLLDVAYLIAHLPPAFCLMKASLVRNPVLGGQSRLAGYVDNSSGPTLIKSCQEKIARGGNLVIFPEGTRTENGRLLPFKMGFALLATTAQVPVQALHIDLSENYLGKKWPFFQQPRMPVQCKVRVGEKFEPRPGEDARSFGKRIEAYYASTEKGKSQAAL